ncbi:MAG: HIT family protein, partial [Pseudomonadota bacterium]
MSLDEQYASDNIFAKIINGEMPSVTIRETNDCLSFMDVFP